MSSAISTAATIPVVTAQQTLSGFTVATFDVSAQAQVRLPLHPAIPKQQLKRALCYAERCTCAVQFVSTLAVNIEVLSGPVNVSIVPGSIMSGSVVVGTSVQFLNGDSNSAATYVAAMNSNSASVFGSYSASVTSTTQTSATNPNAQTGELCSLHMLSSAQHCMVFAVHVVCCASAQCVLCGQAFLAQD